MKTFTIALLIIVVFTIEALLTILTATIYVIIKEGDLYTGKLIDKL